MAKKQNTSKPRAAKRNPGNTPAPLTLWQRYKNGELGNAVKAYCKPDKSPLPPLSSSISGSGNSKAER